MDFSGLQPGAVLSVGTAMLVGIAILVAGWVVAKWANTLVLRLGRTRVMDATLVRFVAAVVRYTILGATLIAALQQVGVATTSLVAIFASAGLAIGLALQGSLANVSSGVMILFFRPFVLDDRVTIAGSTGLVTDIGLFSTTLLTAENHTVIVPNGAAMAGTVVNLTTQGRLRGSIDFGVAYGTDLKRAMKVAADAASSVQLVLDEPAPTVSFVEMGASSLKFKVHCWSMAADQVAMMHAVRVAVYEELARQDIEIPFDQLVVHPVGPIEVPKPVPQKSQKARGEKAG